MIQKHKSILNILKTLNKIFERESIEIVDYWSADLFAIGLKNDKMLIYINTFTKQKGGIYFEIEDVHSDSINPNVIESGYLENINFLEELLKRIFNFN